MLKKLTILLVCLLAFQFAYAQNNLKAYKKTAEEAVAAKNYSAAVGYYKVIIDDAENDDVENLYKAGDAARRYRVYQTSESYFQRVTEKEDANRYPLTYYWLGVVQKRQAKYDAAIASFEKYLSSELKDGEYADKAYKHISDSRWAKDLIANKKDLNVKHLNETINSCESEASAIHMGGELYYSSFLDKNPIEDEPNLYSRIWVADHLDTSAFHNARVVEALTSANEHIANPSFTEDGYRVYYNVCNNINSADLRCKIYYKDKDDKGNWGEGVALSEAINMDGYTASQPSVGKSKTGRTLLFFSSDRPNGVGELDIWCSIADEGSDEFSAPFNIKSLNSEADDVTPYFHAASQTLYFSSDGRQTMGGYDVYSARKNGSLNTDWTEAEHLGAAVNSSYDDVYYSVSSDHKKRYFSSNRPGTTCADTTQECTFCNDIYMYEGMQIELLALTFNKISKEELLGCTVTLMDLTTGLEVPSVSAEGNQTRYLLEPEREYKVVATKDEYTMDLNVFDTKGITGDTFIEKRLYLEPQIKLIVLTYELPDSTILNGCTVDLFNVTLNSDTSATQEFKNRFEFLLRTGMIYNGTGTHVDFPMSPKIAEISTKGISEPTTITRKLYFEKNKRSPYLPDFVIYFDNDRPYKYSQSIPDSTRLSYGTLYTNYMKRRAKFISRNAGDKKAEIIDFFDNYVTKGWQDLQNYADFVLTDLRAGNRVEIKVLGHASPLAPSAYNLVLTERRVVSLKNYFRSYSAEMKGYVDDLLIFVPDPRGEPEVSSVDDNPKNPNASIYSKEASLERRVEIRVEAIKLSYKSTQQN